MAVDDHPSRDWRAALEAFHRALALDPGNKEYSRATADYATKVREGGGWMTDDVDDRPGTPLRHIGVHGPSLPPDQYSRAD